MKDPFDKRVFLFDMCEIYGNIKENKLKTKNKSMEEIWHKITTSKSWFMGALTIFFVCVFFLWYVINPQEFDTTIEGWFRSIEAIFWRIITLFIAGGGIFFLIKKVFKF